MPLSRRSMLSIAGGAVVVGTAGYAGWRRVLWPPAVAAAAGPHVSGRLGQTQQSMLVAMDQNAAQQHEAVRSLGDPSAKVTVMEFFSLTCIQTGKVRFVYHDFPLDQVALTAAMVARYLPPAQYYPFVSALLASQDRWAFARGVNNTDEIWKLAALAGMSRDTFDKAISDADLRDWILAEQKKDQDKYSIDSTPSFVIDGKKYAGEMGYDAFRKLIPDA
jgi:protein-disulfide isomerase